MTQLPPQVPIPPVPPPDGVVPPKRKKNLVIGGYVAAFLSVLILIAGAMLGIMPKFMAFLAVPVVILVLAIVGMMSAATAIARQTADRGQAVGKLVLSLFVVLLLLFAASVIAPPLFTAGNMSKASGCGMNLSNIGKAIAIYKAQNHEQFPPNLAVLLGEDALSPKTLHCPTDGSKALVNGSSYFYCAPDGDKDVVSTTIIACDIAPVHPVGGNRVITRNYLRADLSVQKSTEPGFQRLLQQPENRRFAEELAKGVTMTPPERVTYIAPRGETP